MLNDSNTNGMEHLLILQAQQGDEIAFTRLFQMHYSILYKYIIKMTVNPLISEDILQETMLKCYLNMKKYDNRSRFTSWMITIATRTYVDYLRKKKREVGLFKKVTRERNELIKWQLQQHSNDFRDVMEIITDLKPNYRIPLLLKHYYGFTYDEIAVMLDLREGTVKSRVHKSLTIIRKEMEKNEGLPS